MPLSSFLKKCRHRSRLKTSTLSRCRAVVGRWKFVAWLKAPFSIKVRGWDRPGFVVATPWCMVQCRVSDTQDAQRLALGRGTRQRGAPSTSEESARGRGAGAKSVSAVTSARACGLNPAVLACRWPCPASASGTGGRAEWPGGLRAAARGFRLGPAHRQATLSGHWQWSRARQGTSAKEQARWFTPRRSHAR